MFEKLRYLFIILYIDNKVVRIFDGGFIVIFNLF